MAEAVFRSFEISRPEIWPLVSKFVRAHAPQAIDAGAPLHLFVVSDDLDRLDVQVSHYWCCLRQFAEVAWVEGRLFSEKEWHEKLVPDFLGVMEVVDKKTGKAKLERRSIARGKITVGEMARYTRAVQAYGSETFAIDWDAQEQF